MIIGFDASRAFTKNKTGTENYSHQILYHLSTIDHTNTYYIYLRPGCHPEFILGSKQMPKQVRHDNYGWPSNFHFITIPFPRLWTQIGLAKQTFSDKLDVLFIPAHTLPIIHKPWLKTVVTVHDLGAEYLPTTHQLKQRLYLNLMTHHQLKSATHLIAVSYATKDDLIKKVGIKPEKVSVIYEGYNKDLYRPVSKLQLHQTIAQYKLEDQNYFLFVGTIQPRKNLARLIKAYAQFLKKQQDHKPPFLALAGGKGWLSNEIFALPDKLGIKDKVKFLGYVLDEKLPALYSGAIAFVFPSLFEGFGLPILEAMACKCPVITSNLSSMPEVAGKSALLVNPYNEEEIAKALEKIHTQEKLRKELINKGLTQVQKFSWEKAALKTLKVLESTS